jgi:hypothetical protein
VLGDAFMAGGNRCSSGAGDGVSDTGGACRPGAAARAYLTATRLLPPDAGPGSAASEACRQQLAAKLAAAQELLSDGQGAAVWAAEPQAVMPQLLRLSAPHPIMRDGAPHGTIPVLAGRQLAQLQLDAAHDIDAPSTAAAVSMLMATLRITLPVNADVPAAAAAAEEEEEEEKEGAGAAPATIATATTARASWLSGQARVALLAGLARVARVPRSAVGLACASSATGGDSVMGSGSVGGGGVVGQAVDSPAGGVLLLSFKVYFGSDVEAAAAFANLVQRGSSQSATSSLADSWPELLGALEGSCRQGCGDSPHLQPLWQASIRLQDLTQHHCQAGVTDTAESYHIPGASGPADGRHRDTHDNYEYVDDNLSNHDGDCVVANHAKADINACKHVLAVETVAGSGHQGALQARMARLPYARYDITAADGRPLERPRKHPFCMARVTRDARCDSTWRTA